MFVLCSLAIWFSPWIPTLPNFRPIPRVSRLIAHRPLAISDLTNPDSLTWNLSLLTFLFDSSIVTEILSIKIRANSDALLWTTSSSGSFTTKSAHHLYTSHRPLQSSPVISTSWKGLWKLKLEGSLENGMEHCSYKGSYFFIHQFYVGYILFSLFPFYRFPASFIFLVSYCTSYMEKFFLAFGYYSFAYFYYV